MNFPFPSEKPKQYLGAIHGLSGILYIFINCVEISENLRNNQEFIASLKFNSEFILSL